MLQAPSWSTRWRSEMLDAKSLLKFSQAWEKLSRNALEDNVYYTPSYVAALLDTCEKNTDVEFATVWMNDILVALLPVAPPKTYPPYFFRIGKAWETKYTFSCMPLLHGEYSREGADRLATLLESVHKGEWLFPLMNAEGKTCALFKSVLESKGVPWVSVSVFDRASLVPGSTFEDHMLSCVPAKRRKELARTRRRLSEAGELRHVICRTEEELSRAVAAFMRIEADGWKGKKGTALNCTEATREFAYRVFRNNEDTQCRADMLTLNGAPIAVSLVLLAGSTGFTVKCTYNEEFRSYSPGLLLEESVVRGFLNEGWAARLDAATAGEHVIDSLWPSRVQVADLAFSFAKNIPDARLRAFERSNQARINAKTFAKRALARVERWTS